MFTRKTLRVPVARQAAAMSAGFAMANAAPALATWGEGSEPGQNIDPVGGAQRIPAMLVG